MEEEMEKVIDRNEPDSDGAKLALISKWTKLIGEAKSHHETAFTRMRDDMDYALTGKSKSADVIETDEQAKTKTGTTTSMLRTLSSVTLIKV